MKQIQQMAQIKAAMTLKTEHSDLLAAFGVKTKMMMMNMRQKR